MPTITKSNSDNFLTWQKINGPMSLARLQAEGVPACAEGYNLSDLLWVQAVDISVFDNSPTSMYWSSDGLNFYFLANGLDRLFQITVSVPYDISTVTANKAKAIPEIADTIVDVRFNSDGTKCYIGGNSENKIFQYSLTAWDIATLSYDSKSLSVAGQISGLQGFTLTETNVYAGGVNEIVQYSITGGDLSTASLIFNLPIAEAPFFSLAYRNENKLYFAGQSSRIYELIISGGCIKGAIINQQSEALTAQSLGVNGIFFAADGRTVWLTTANQDQISEYWVGCP